jgi:ABC-type transport system involved in cytochrome c biogenesis permease subunit
VPYLPNKFGRWIAAVLVAILLAAVLYNVVVDNMPKGEVRKIKDYKPWSQATLDAAETIPLQSGGRVKPLVTFAGFSMLTVHGARSMEIETEAGKKIKIKPTAWLLDALFRPQLAIQLPTFRVDNSAALEAVGIKTRSKRDRYSYAEIEPGRVKLIELAKSYEAIDAKKRDPIQTQTVDLAYSLRNYESLLAYFEFARYGVNLQGSGEVKDRRTDLSAVMLAAPELRKQLTKSQAAGQPVEPHIQDLLEQVLDASNFAKFGLFILPPTAAKEPLWQSAGNAIMDVMSAAAKDPQLSIDDIQALEATARAANDEPAFQKQLVALNDRLSSRATARGEYKHIPLEAQYYRKNWFIYVLVFYLLGTLTAISMWAFAKYRIATLLAWTTIALVVSGLGICIYAIVTRCIIMQRPPVGNLYDTIIFIAATVVALALIVEWLTRKRFALGIAPILGAVLIVLARRYELGDAKDHMDPLVAVLDSNFWLTIHVLTITLGYSAGLLSAVLSIGYLILRGLGLDGGDQEFRRSLTRAAYGMICLTLFLSLVGTVLGGIWANYSWGRFWGWDPKENGALLIVLWTLSILHARLGGYIKEWGLHFASVFTAIVVTFSWWHVNFLGVGLHNYGFTSGKDTIFVFYGGILLVLLFGVIAMLMEKGAKSRKATAKQKTLQPLRTS